MTTQYEITIASYILFSAISSCNRLFPQLLMFPLCFWTSAINLDALRSFSVDFVRVFRDLSFFFLGKFLCFFSTLKLFRILCFHFTGTILFLEMVCFLLGGERGVGSDFKNLRIFFFFFLRVSPKKLSLL